MEDIETPTYGSSYSNIITEKIRNKNLPTKHDVKTGLKIYFKSMLCFWLICAVIKIVTLTGAIYYNGYTFLDFYHNKNGVLEISARLLSGMPVNSTNSFDNFIIYDENNNLIYDPYSAITYINPCGSHGECIDGSINGTTGKCDCECDNCYISTHEGLTSSNTDEQTCNYKQSFQLVAFLLSFFIGECGADWFYLARGNCCYICGGIGKLLTFGGLMVWWLVDWIRLLAKTFPDGHHHDLCGFENM